MLWPSCCLCCSRSRLATYSRSHEKISRQGHQLRNVHASYSTHRVGSAISWRRYLSRAVSWPRHRARCCHSHYPCSTASHRETLMSWNILCLIVALVFAALMMLKVREGERLSYWGAVV